MGMLLHRQGEARRNNTPPAPPPREAESGTQGNTESSGSGQKENTGRSGGRKPTSKPNKP